MKQQTQLKKGNEIFFLNESLPYTIKATSKRYAVVSRRLDVHEDSELLKFEVKRGAYVTKTEAYNAHKNNPVYSLLDFEEEKKAPDNLIFGNYDYFDEKDCEQCIKDLEEGSIKLSDRNKVDLQIDWNKTINQ